MPKTYISELVDHVKSLGFPERPTLNTVFNVLRDYDGKKATDYVYSVVDILAEDY